MFPEVLGSKYIMLHHGGPWRWGRRTSDTRPQNRPPWTRGSTQWVFTGAEEEQYHIGRCGIGWESTGMGVVAVYVGGGGIGGGACLER